MQFSTGLTPGGLAGAVDRPRNPLIDKAVGRRLSARLDLQAGRRAGRARSRRHHAGDPDQLPRPFRARQRDVPLLEEGRPRHAAAARRDQAILRRLLLRDGAAARHRPPRGDGAPLRLRRAARPRHPRRARRADPEPRLETGDRPAAPGTTGETLIAGIGQGSVLATPLQLATMAARLVDRPGRRAASGARRADAAGRRRRPRRRFSALGVNPGHLALVLDGMNAVVNEPRGTAYAARITDPAYAMGGKSGTSQVRRITQYEREHGVRKASQVPWKERDHALFVAFAPVQAPRYVCAVVVEHGGAEAGGGSAVAAPICRDVLLEAQRRDPARRVPQPDAMAEIVPDRRTPGPAAVGRRAASNDKSSFGIGRRELTLRRQVSRHPVGAAAAARADRRDRLRDAVFGGERRVSALGVAPDDPLRGRARRRDRGRADRHALSGSAPPIGFTRSRWLLVVAVDLRGIVGMGAQRWIDLGLSQLQPSEVMKIALVLALARYFHCLPPENIGRLRYLLVPALMIAVPVLLVLKQPDLGTAMMLLAAGGGAAVSRRRAGSGCSRRRRRERRRPRRWPGRCCATIRRAGSTPFSIPSATRSAPAITSCNRRSRSARAGCSARASCRARRAI